VKNLTYEKIQ
jgi:hypothetical protein